jgi:alpha-glucosidase
MQYTHQEAIDPLTLTVFPLTGDGTVATSYYEDDGKSFDYLKGASLRRTHTQQRAGKTLAVEIGAAAGSYHPPTRHLAVRFMDIAKEPAAVMLNGTPLSKTDSLGTSGSGNVWQYDAATHTVTARAEDRMTGQRFELRYE